MSSGVEASKSCIGCTDKFDGVAKINFSCGHEYCNKCTDKIISKSTSGNNPKCSICTPDIEEGGSKRCEYCSECCKSCGGFVNAFFDCGVNMELVLGFLFIFCVMSFFFAISSAVFGIVGLVEHDYDVIVRIFIIISVTYNLIFCIIIFRTFLIIDSLDAEHMRAVRWTMIILTLIHLFLIMFGFYNLSYYFNYNKPVIVLVASSCANIFIAFFVAVLKSL